MITVSGCMCVRIILSKPIAIIIISGDTLAEEEIILRINKTYDKFG